MYKSSKTYLHIAFFKGTTYIEAKCFTNRELAKKFKNNENIFLYKKKKHNSLKYTAGGTSTVLETQV